MKDSVYFPNADLSEGDIVRITSRPEWGLLRVVEVSRPSLATLERLRDGVAVTVGRGAVERLQGPMDAQDRCQDG